MKANSFSKTNIILNIVGDGSEINNLKLLVKKYELDKKIKFIGKIENTKLNEYLKNADIFIQASNYEGLPSGTNSIKC